MFGTASRRQLRTKVKKYWLIRNKTYNTPGTGVSVDQLQSYQPGLVPQLLGKLTSLRIWAAQVMVDHFSYLTYGSLVKITIQEDALSVKSASERWSATFGVKINRYNSYNGIFSEYNFISAIKDANKAIKFCGVGSHHQNSTVERKIQNLTI